MAKKITITDIAQYAGVSKSTVSNYLNGRFQRMSPQTKAQIASVIERLDYRPSSVAKNMRIPQEHTVGIILSEFNGHPVVDLLNGMYNVLREQNYKILLFNTHNDKDLELEYIQSCIDMHVSGLIVRPSNLDSTYYNQLWDRGFPIVLIDLNTLDWGHDISYIENRSIILDVCGRLRDNDYGRIYWFTDNMSPLNTKAIRRLAFREFCDLNGYPAPETTTFFIPNDDPDHRLKIHRAVLNVLDDPTAEHKVILADGATILRRVLDELMSERISIPYQVGVCGFSLGGSEKWIAPGISTISLPYYEVGYSAAQLLTSRIRTGTSAPAQRVAIKAVFNTYASTAKF